MSVIIKCPDKENPAHFRRLCKQHEMQYSKGFYLVCECAFPCNMILVMFVYAYNHR
jgi:hypothetical protein